MLKKTKLRALSPGQWARMRVPDYECWQKPGEWSGPMAGKEVDVCVIPCYGPRYDSPKYFHWSYRAAYRNPGGSAWSNYYRPGWQSARSVGLRPDRRQHRTAPTGTTRRCASITTARASGSTSPPAMIPSSALAATGRATSAMAAASLFAHSRTTRASSSAESARPRASCASTRRPSIISTPSETGHDAGLLGQLNRQLDYLADYGSNGYQCVLSKDFAPHSFTFGMYRPGTNETS